MLSNVKMLLATCYISLVGVYIVLGRNCFIVSKKSVSVDANMQSCNAH